MRVSEVMSKPALSVGPDDLLADVIPVMIRNHVSGLPVVDEKGLVFGILSEGDLLRRIELGTGGRKEGFWARFFMLGSDEAECYRRVHGRRVRDVMTDKAVTVGAEDTLADAARLMHAFHVKRLPVVEDGKLVGILSRADYVKALGRFLAPSSDQKTVSDDEIVSKVREEFARNVWAETSQVQISCDKGQVTLRGYATEVQRRALVVAAEIVEGVRSVNDLIEVNDPLTVYGM